MIIWKLGPYGKLKSTDKPNRFMIGLEPEKNYEGKVYQCLKYSIHAPLCCILMDAAFSVFHFSINTKYRYSSKG